MTIPPPLAEPDVEVPLIAGAVLSCPLVAELHPGAYGEIATYLPGRRVPGIRVGADVIEVHVVAHLAATVPQVAAAIRAVLTPWSTGRRVDVVIEDLRLPGEDPPPSAPPTTTPSAPLSVPSSVPPSVPTDALPERADIEGPVGTRVEVVGAPAEVVVPVPASAAQSATVTVEVGGQDPDDPAPTTVVRIAPADDHSGEHPDRHRGSTGHEEHSS